MVTPPMPAGKRYYSLSDYYRSLFGEKVYRLLLDGGWGCPNRDGTVSNTGCSFCSTANRDFSERITVNNTAEALDKAIARLSQKTRAGKFIAYFGTDSSTYAPVEKLEALYSAVLQDERICGLSVSTRADCLDSQKLRLLSSLSRKKPVWVELGLQTSREDTAQKLGLGLSRETVAEGFRKLAAYEIPSVAHIIFSLPGETREDMLRSVDFAASLGISGIKIHMLHLLKGTALYREYCENPFPLLSLEEYSSILLRAIRNLPRNIVLYRFTGDGFRGDLEYPLWTADKKKVLNSILSRFEAENLIQGEDCSSL